MQVTCVEKGQAAVSTPAVGDWTNDWTGWQCFQASVQHLGYRHSADNVVHWTLCVSKAWRVNKEPRRIRKRYLDPDCVRHLSL